jgi:hypothetical protein
MDISHPFYAAYKELKVADEIQRWQELLARHYRKPSPNSAWIAVAQFKLAA